MLFQIYSNRKPIDLSIPFKFLYGCLLFLFTGNLSSQSPPLYPNDFIITGETTQTGNQCYRLTSAIDWTSGAIWYKDPIDLSFSFQMELNIMFGCEDELGADGMVFVFSPYRTVPGYQGEGMGFAGLSPSLGIEVDTWENDHLGDPVQDHIAILQHGYVHHGYNLAGPMIIPNVEDCALHAFAIHWDNKEKKLSVRLDGKPVLHYQGDMVKDLFGGDPKVFWGVTAATGRYHNRHEICFEKLDFTPPLASIHFSPDIEKRLLKGEVMTLRDVQFETGNVSLTNSSLPDLHRLINLLKDNPTAKIAIEGHTDNLGSEQVNQDLSTKRASSVANYLIKNGIQKDRIEAKGYGEQHPLVSNQNPSGRRQNRRIDVYLYIPRS
jgi:outer membrane protein OmpA-like peptidoglycan-associated protein